jgi:hypothetical protein
MQELYASTPEAEILEYQEFINYLQKEIHKTSDNEDVIKMQREINDCEEQILLMKDYIKNGVTELTLKIVDINTNIKT